jgi:hypothetical protein
MSAFKKDERTYKLNHEVLPYEIERSLPFPIIDKIYSFLRPKYSQTPRRIKIERYQIELNHKMTIYKELLLEKQRRRLEKERERQALVDQLDKIIHTLEKLL